MKEIFDMSAIDRTFTSFKNGDMVKATVVYNLRDKVIVNIGGKKDGFIAKEDATLDGNYNPDEFKAGEEIDVMIIENKSKDSDYISLSKKLQTQKGSSAL